MRKVKHVLLMANVFVHAAAGWMKIIAQLLQ